MSRNGVKPEALLVLSHEALGELVPDSFKYHATWPDHGSIFADEMSFKLGSNAQVEASLAARSAGNDGCWVAGWSLEAHCAGEG